MISNQWYAVLSSADVEKKKVIGVRRFGEDLVFFRDEKGNLGCVTSLCAHRGASLEKGCVKEGHIQCPFHGIEYDVHGKCVHIPSEGRASKMDFSRFDLKHYEVREIGGIVFLWYGEEEPDHEPEVFDVVTDPSFAHHQMNDEWNIHYSRVIENQLDVSHLAFVHHNTIGRGNKSLVNGPKVVWLDDLTLQTSADNAVDSGQTPKEASESQIKSTNLTFRFPNMWLNHVTDKIMILAFFIPVDDRHSIIALRFYNKITGMRGLDGLIARLGSVANGVIERQDKRIVQTQHPRKSALYMKEKLVAADLPIMEYRRKRHELKKGTKALAGAKDTQEPATSKKEGTMDNKAMFKLSYGLFVLTARDDIKANGCITNTAIQVASEPNQISFAVNKANYTHDMLIRTKKANISVISEAASFDLFKHFGFQSGRDVDKFAGYTDCKEAENGIPYITVGTNAYFSIDIQQTVDLGSHTLFIGVPTAMEVLSDTPSATYSYYQDHIKPKPEAVGKTPSGETVWRCKICGYEYVGEELPEDFICPICKHPASDFEKVV